MAIRYGRGDVKQTTTGFRGPLMVQSLTSAKSKFLSLRRGSCEPNVVKKPCLVIFLPFEIAPIPQRQPLRNAKRFRSSLQQTITNIAKILGQARY